MIESIRAEYKGRRVRGAVGDALLWLALLIPWLAGWIVGFIWRCCVWLAAAVAAGFKTGAGDALRNNREGGG